MMTIKYLVESQVTSLLSNGKAVEQWLGHTDESGYRLIKWLRIDCEKANQFSVTCFEAFDEGSFDFLDLYEFSALDPDLPYGEIVTFNDLKGALYYAQSNLAASLSKFVGAGMIQDVYAEFLKLEGLPPG